MRILKKKVKEIETKAKKFAQSVAITMSEIDKFDDF